MKFKLFPSNSYKGEKIAWVLFYVLFVGGFLFLQLSALEIFHNDYTKLCNDAGWAWKISGLCLAGYVGYAVYQWVNDAVNKPSFWLIFGAMVLSILCHCGFNF